MTELLLHGPKDIRAIEVWLSYNIIFKQITIEIYTAFPNDYFLFKIIIFWVTISTKNFLQFINNISIIIANETSQEIF